MRKLAHIERCKEVWFLLIVSFLFFLFRLPSLYEPYWYGDEGIYHVIGDALNQGRFLYTEIWDNKPPLLYVLYALLHADQFSIKLFSLFVGMLSVMIFFLLTKRLFHQPFAWYITTSIFAFFLATPIIEGNIANAENFMILPIIMASYLLYLALSPNIAKNKYIFNARFLILSSGFLLGLAFLFKIVAFFDFLGLLLFIFISRLGKERITVATWKAVCKEVCLFITGFMAPFLLVVFYFAIHHKLVSFLQATFFSNVGYVGWKNEFIIPQGLLLLKLLFLIAAACILFSRRKRMQPAQTFILSWLLFSLFNAFFSQRPYIHYQLVLLPSLSLFIGFFFLPLQRERKILLSLCIGLLLVLLQNSFDRWTLKKTLAYYENFSAFIFHKKPFTEYQKFFDWNTNRDYQLAWYIKQHAKNTDNLFVWGNSAQIYHLAGKLPPGRYTVAYHIAGNAQAVAETKNALYTTNPRFIIMMPDIAYYPFSLHNYAYKVTIDNTHIYERLF